MKKTLCCALALALSACDCGGPQTNKLEGELSFKSDLQFGVLAVNERVTLKATLQNVGGARVVVDAIEVGAPFEACIEHLDGTCTKDTELEVGQEASVAVTYAPTAANATDAENHRTDVVVVNDSPTRPRVQIHVVGHAVPLRLLVDPTGLEFGTLEVGDLKELSVRFENKGLTGIKLSNAAIDSAAFQADLTKVPALLDRGGAFTLPITYAPQAGQEDAAALTLTTDVGSQAQVKVTLHGNGLLAQVSLCFGFEGGAQTCLPDAAGKLAGELDFGALDLGVTRKASLTLKNAGNLPVELFGLANASGAQAVDSTAAKNPCGLSPALPDFTFTPPKFGAKLPEDPTASEPNPPKEQAMQVAYSPRFNCPPQGSNAGDVADRGVISLKAGTSPKAPSFFVDLKGYSKVGLAQTDNVFWDVRQPAPQDYKVFNTGQGPLQVSGVELVEADGYECAVGCAGRPSCASSSKPECALFGWSAGPNAVTLPGAAAGAKTEAVVGKVTYTPGTLCGTSPDAGSCFDTPTVRVCTRVSSDDPFRPKVCGELKGKTF